MKLRHLLACTLIAALPFTTSYAKTTETHAQTKTDGEIIAWLITVNQNEINAAKVAETKKLSDKDVTDFAQLMIKEHGENLEGTKKISHSDKIKPVETAAIKDMQKNGQEEGTKLKALDGTKFEVVYIDDMVKGHENVLKMLDDTYLKEANNAALKQHLTDTRTHVVAHLEKAKKIQADLATKS